MCSFKPIDFICFLDLSRAAMQLEKYLFTCKTLLRVVQRSYDTCLFSFCLSICLSVYLMTVVFETYKLYFFILCMCLEIYSTQKLKGPNIQGKLLFETVLLSEHWCNKFFHFFRVGVVYHS